MKKKIYLYLLLMGLTAVLAAALITAVIFSSAVEKEILQDMAEKCQIMTRIYDEEQKAQDCAAFLPKEDRLTVISPRGEVLYESTPDVVSDNHLTRPEIIGAFNDGSGHSKRTSATLGYDTYYWAERSQNGDIVRLSQNVDTKAVFYRQLLIYWGILLALIISLAMVLAHYLTKRIVEPIDKMADDLENIEQSVPYPELAPFARTLQEAEEQKKQNEEQRREFTANVSHELKTPLTSILGYSEMIETGLVNEGDIKLFAGKIRTEAERQLHLIADIIELSELDVLQSKDSFTKVDLYELSENVIDYLSFAAQNYEVSLSIEGEHLAVLGNKSLLEELIYNLCDNAIRYNRPGGKVQIRIARRGEKVVLAVSDNGIGIEPQDQGRIFERFYRVDKSRSRDTGGTGLGLAIVKHVAIQHDAQLFVKSLPGMGTTIEVIFAEA